jgi:outer membrane protein OmpA-like peptidoglycan-associated protein
MAEVLILLLFLLMLALTHALTLQDRKMSDETNRANLAERELEVFRLFVEALQRSDTQPGEVAHDIARRLAMQVQLQREIERLRAEAARFQSELREAADAVQAFRDVAAEARRIDPSAPPAATLQRMLRQAAEAQPSRATSSMLSESIHQLETAARAIAPDAPPAATLQLGLERLIRTGALTDVVVAVRDTERRLAGHLQGEFGADLPRWGATFDAGALTIRFQNPDVLFEGGSAELQPGFARQLTEFFPRYIASLREFRDDIQEVRIEGHTSSEWQGAAPLEAYFRNMALSQARTRSVLDFGLTRTAIPPDMRDWARGLITANGLSSSRLRFRPDGAEDREGSRRVEFRVVMKLRENVMRVVEGQR